MTRGSATIAAVVVLTFVVCFASAQKISPLQPVISDLALSYQSLKKLTDGGVSVNPDLAASCVGISQTQLESAQKTYGPHANCFINIFMNDVAAEAFRTHANAYPVGSVVVKEKHAGSHRSPGIGHMVRDQLNGVGGMVKRPAGFDPEHGDWEYFYFEQPSKIESGRIASCVGCHSGARSTDYVFGSWTGLQPNPFASATGIDVLPNLEAKAPK